MKHLLALLLSLMSSAALAQTTGTLDPSPAPAKPSANEDVPPGGCMPIGLTAAGEIVFPIQCRALIERARGTPVVQKPAAVEGKSAAVDEKPAALEQKPVAAEEKPAAAEQKPVAVEAKPTVVEAKPAAVEEKPAVGEAKPAAVEEKPAAKQSDDLAPEDSNPANKRKRGERQSRQRAESTDNCTHFRTYDRASGTYRSFDGRIRRCR